MRKKQNQKVRLSLSIDKVFHDLLSDHAQRDYLKVATWTKRFLMQNLTPDYFEATKCLTKDGKGM